MGCKHYQCFLYGMLGEVYPRAYVESTVGTLAPDFCIHGYTVKGDLHCEWHSSVILSL